MSITDLNKFVLASALNSNCTYFTTLTKQVVHVHTICILIKLVGPDV